MSHVTYEWVTSRMNESRHICMSHVTYARVMSYMNEACHIWTSHVTSASCSASCWAYMTMSHMHHICDDVTYACCSASCILLCIYTQDSHYERVMSHMHVTLPLASCKRQSLHNTMKHLHLALSFKTEHMWPCHICITYTSCTCIRDDDTYASCSAVLRERARKSDLEREQKRQYSAKETYNFHRSYWP